MIKRKTKYCFGKSPVEGQIVSRKVILGSAKVPWRDTKSRGGTQSPVEGQIKSRESCFSKTNPKLVGALFPTNHLKPREHIKDRA